MFNSEIDSTINELHYINTSLKVFENQTEIENKKFQVDETGFVISEDPQYRIYSQYDIKKEDIIKKSINLYICYIFSLRETVYRTKIAINLNFKESKEVEIDEFGELRLIRHNILHKDKKRSKVLILDFLKPKNGGLISMDLKLYIKLCTSLKKSLANYLK